MTEILVVITTIPKPELSESISRTLIEESLVACVNIVPGLNSIYRWEGQICNSAEQLLVMKTTRSKLQSLEQRLSRLHPYKVFEFVVLSTDSVNTAYAAWVNKACESKSALKAD